MESFIETASSFKLSSYTGIEDGADKASFLFSVIVITVCSIIVTTNAYFLDPISCYVPVTINADFDGYVSNYCWVHGTIPFLQNVKMPDNKEAWKSYDAHNKINYYQWVPLVLALQGIMYYLPRLIWQTIVYNMSGTDLESLVNSAKTAVREVGEDRDGIVKQIAGLLEDMFFQFRYLPPKSSAHISARRRAGILCGNKRTGVFLFSFYFFIKVLYLTNAFCQLYLMQQFLSLGTKSISWYFGWELLNDLRNGIYWRENLMFPRVTYCYIGDIRVLQQKNAYLAQCALPVNMINEKIYIFLWFWTIGVIIITLISIPSWIHRMSHLKNRRQFVKKFLKLKSDHFYNKDHSEKLTHFVNMFLRMDGVFLLHILSINAGEMITSEIVTALWNVYQEKYENCDFKKGLIQMKEMDDESDEKQQFI